MRRFKLRRRASYKARTTGLRPARRKNNPIVFSLHDPAFVRAARSAILSIDAHGVASNGKRFICLTRSRLPKRFQLEFYSVVR